VAELEAHLKAIALAEKTAPPPPVQTSPSAPPPVPVSEPMSLAGTTINFLIDGYYSYNFSAPIGRSKRLQAYDVSSNASASTKPHWFWRTLRILRLAFQGAEYDL
jgi:hypothetical protein